MDFHELNHHCGWRKSYSPI